MHHGPELTIVFIVCFTLVVGAAMSMFSSRLRIPYTIAMLLVGLLVGSLLRQMPAASPGAEVVSLLSSGSAISPDLIMFVFLPVLVFESAFSLEVHAFRKNLGAVLVLSGPALIVCTAATGALLVVLTSASWSWGWGWMPALVFGALISATDPVAVVALLRGLGAPKRLSLLIEGESLLNDGTAIVVFSVLMLVLTGEAQPTVGATLLHFVWVAGGGLVVGLVLAAMVSGWLARVFNAPLVEITLTLTLAYLAMFVAEALFHVSGVIAVVAAGLWMSGPGRVHVSPEVMHFLHRFWEMLSYLANTLIFFLVGLVIATELANITFADVALVLCTYAGVMIIRTGVVFGARPIMNRVSFEISIADAKVMSWGGLRGAVSLALALVVSHHPGLDPTLRRQFLLLTAGVVLLTILVNGSTMGMLLHRLGFDRAPAGERIAQQTTRAWVLERVMKEIDAASDSRDLRTVNWREVVEVLETDRDELERQIEGTRRELSAAGPQERARGLWRQVLSVERAAYWNAFSHGTVGARAAKILDHEIDLQLDRLSLGDQDPPARRYLEPQSWLMRRLPKWLETRAAQIERLALRYDLLRAEGLAAERVLEVLVSLADVDPDMLEAVRSTYQRYRHESKAALEDLRSNLPEITRVIETRLAHRIRLNFEREGYRELAHEGAIDPGAAADALSKVEERMKGLGHFGSSMELPETADLCRDAPMFAGMSEEALERLADITIERALPPGEVLFKQGRAGKSMAIIARGAVGVYRESTTGGEQTLLDILGGGEVIGEMALLTGSPRNATIRALTTVTVGVIPRKDFDALMHDQPELRLEVWRRFAFRRFDNYVRGLDEYGRLSRDDRSRWFELGTLEELGADEHVVREHAGVLFVVTGAVRIGDRLHEAPAMLTLAAEQEILGEVSGWVVTLPLLDSAEAVERSVAMPAPEPSSTGVGAGLFAQIPSKLRSKRPAATGGHQ